VLFLYSKSKGTKRASLLLNTMAPGKVILWISWEEKFKRKLSCNLISHKTCYLKEMWKLRIILLQTFFPYSPVFFTETSLFYFSSQRSMWQWLKQMSYKERVSKTTWLFIFLVLLFPTVFHVALSFLMLCQIQDRNKSEHKGPRQILGLIGKIFSLLTVIFLT
jgi:hypothetical protein